MKSFKQYLAESEQHQYQPLTGDVVSFQINEELEITADVIEVLDEGIVLDLDATALHLLQELDLVESTTDLTESEQYRCPNCKSANVQIQDRDYGSDLETGYQDRDEYYQCQNCGAEGLSDELIDASHGNDWDRGGADAWYHRRRKEGQSAEYYAGYDDTLEREGSGGGKDYGTPKYRKPVAQSLDEAEYQGRKVQLGKPMKGDVKKFKVYVKNPKTGNVKKVNFGDKNMEIKRDDPKRRKNFRARHGCGTSKASDRTKARYWSCRMWSSKPVSKIVKEATGKPYHLMTPDERILDRIQKNREIDARVAQKQSELTQYWDQKQSDVRTCIIDFNIQLSRYIQRNFVNDPEYRNMPVYAKLEDGHLVIAKPELAAANSREDLRELGYRMITNRQVAGAPDLTQISSMPLKRVLQNGFVLGGRYTLDEKPIIDDYSVSFKTEYHSTVNPSKKEKIQLGTLGFTVAPSYNAPE